MMGRRIERFRKVQRLFGLVQTILSIDDIFRCGGSKDDKRWKYFKNNY